MMAQQDEATARWRIVDDDGVIVADGFATNAVAWKWYGLTRVARMILTTPKTNGASAPHGASPMKFARIKQARSGRW